MMRLGSVSSITTLPDERMQAPNIGKSVRGTSAQCSREGEDNSMHVAMAIVAVGVLAVVAGLLNVKISAGK